MAETTERKKIVVDREKTCPFLLRIFCRTGSHHRIDEFNIERTPGPQEELQIYTWKDATLRELATLLREVTPDANRPHARFSFRLIYLNYLRSHYIAKDLGVVMNARKTHEEDKTLDDARFVIGDYISVAIFHGPPVAPSGPARSINRPYQPEDREHLRGGGDRERERERDKDRDRKGSWDRGDRSGRDRRDPVVFRGDSYRSR